MTQDTNVTTYDYDEPLAPRADKIGTGAVEKFSKKLQTVTFLDSLTTPRSTDAANQLRTERANGTTGYASTAQGVAAAKVALQRKQQPNPKSSSSSPAEIPQVQTSTRAMDKSTQKPSSPLTKVDKLWALTGRTRPQASIIPRDKNGMIIRPDTSAYEKTSFYERTKKTIKENVGFGLP